MSRYDAGEGPDPAQPYVAPLQAWEAFVHDRGRIENDLYVAYVNLLTRYREKLDECEREKRNAMLWEKEQRMSERELNSLKTVAESSPFAFVVVDGDGAVFREDLISRGEDGGIEAAHELHQQLKTYFHDQPQFCNIDTIFVHVVLSLEGLSRALHNSGAINPPDYGALTKFARGFARAQPLFTFTDVGYGKEQADHKVRKLFEVMEKNIQCRCLVLAGCHDNGYATFLESFRGNQKICLLETTPPAADFRKFTFKRVAFPSVFRSEPLLSRSTFPPGFTPATGMTPFTPGSMTSPSILSPGSGIGINPLPSPAVTASNESPRPTHPAPVAPAPIAAPKPEPQPSMASTANTASSYATVGRSSAPLTINIAAQKKPAVTRLFIQLNKHDERVDIPLTKPDPNAVKSLDDRRQMSGMNLCNRYHLANSCKNANCSFYHGERLNPAEILALRHKTRNLVCSSGHYCREIACNLGHHCPNPGSCYFGEDCRFSEMHGMDITPTIKIYEDGNREVL